MKTKKNQPSSRPDPKKDTSEDGGWVTCDDVQMLLTEYMMRELGDVQSRVVREHLRTCEACRREAADLEATLATLRDGDTSWQRADPRLSDEHRARMMRAVLHPVLDWVYRHHRLVSILVALMVLVSALYVVRHAELFRVEKVEEGIPIWRMFRSGRLPELVDQAARQVPPRQEQREEMPSDGTTVTD